MHDAEETRTSAQVGPSTSSSLATSSSVDEGRFVPGTVIVGRYRIISLLGRGGMGEVYRATDLTLGQPVALKFLPDTGAGFERMLERFQNEVRVARQVSHPNVCRVYDLGEFEGMPYMSMEYIDGEDLSGLLSRIGRLPADKALDIARKICAGLAAAHDKGVIHRDLKPANIMLDKRGNAIIMDFGLAAVTNELRGPESRSGSPAYQAPEQLRGEEVTAKSDIYALGLVLYELFTGRRAYEAKSIPELIRVQEDAQFVSMQSIASEIDPTVEKAIRKCLDPTPINRPLSALSVSAALPGGDPLAAALAAGEIPSPELVAAAGRHEGLPLKYSAPMALALIVFLMAVPWIRHNREKHTFTPMNIAPEALASKVREFATAFGYPQTPADSVFDLVNHDGLIGAAGDSAKASSSGRDELRRWFSAESPMQLWYRESPQPMVTWNGSVTSAAPAPITSGMIEAQISTTGELRRFDAIPSQLESSAAPTAVDADLIARTTGFDLNRMQEVEAKFAPLYAFDWQKAWKGKHPKLDLDVQIEVAAWHGKLTHLHVVWPWSTASRMPESQVRSAGQTGFQLAWVGVYLLVFLVSGFLAIRNLRAGRGDTRGAVRLGAIVFVLRSIHSLAGVHWAVDIGTYWTVTRLLSAELVQAAVISGMYLALEPAVRARWPRVLVSWNRVLRGQWNDALVGTRVLQGVFIATVISGIVMGIGSFQAARGNFGTNTDPSGGISTRLFVADLAELGARGIEFGLLVVFATFLFRALLRKDWLASLGMALVMTALNSDLWRHFNAIDFALYLALMSLIAFVLLRLGLVATIVVATFVDLLLHVPGPQDLTKWYEWTVIAYPAVALVVVLWAFWRASGEEALRSGEPAEG